MNWRDESGNVAVVMALGATLIAGGAGFGVEVGYWRFLQGRLQQAADSAAYAAALELRARAPVGQMTSAATAVAEENSFDPAKGSLQLSTPSPLAANDARSVQVALTRSERPLFVAMFRSEPVLIGARASARYTPAANACVLALDRSASQAAYFSGSASLTLNGCVVASNSSASDAIKVQGASTVTAPCMYATGGAEVTDGVHLTACSGVQTDEPLTPDPYAGYVIPSSAGLVERAAKQDHYEQGIYPHGIDTKGGATFAPGRYFITGGDFRIKDAVSGSGVTFFFLNNTVLNTVGTNSMTFSAPTSGPDAGLLFVGARTNTAEIKINGSAASSLTGALYFPGQALDYQGSFTGQDGCVQVIGRTVTWTGNAAMSVDCSAFGLSRIEVGGAARLIR
jgi:hypothetical protein